MPQYRALVGLSVPEDEKETKRLKDARARGHPLPSQARKTVRVEAGEVAVYIPESSVVWLLAQGLIEEVV